ncbi:uncharacterized protein E5676_scaffold118G00400 [Cucumis melo var. makuwa]|uniref:RNase H type-1 domain-containing protein n=1 Tax=Cucumis melo var. makuwa TaxID=1194695 RepID=A0A5A7U212_CUCMM|nr:uncharacterized protein E6C27_scaffold1591G00280 [Cucumis melo var. makuwa]TYK08689.1 uncharacterized protein E5676_scaffold118G00400 [Cucumis melo var. makuwa]
MQEMYELNLGLFRGCGAAGISPYYTDWVYHRELVNLYRGIERVDEGTSSERENLSHDFFSPAMEPSLENSRFMVVSKHSNSESVDNNFYDVLDKVLHVSISTGMTCLAIQVYMESVILANQTHQVFYFEDLQNEIVIGHSMDEHIENDTLCKPRVVLIVVQRSIVHHVADDFINDDDAQLSPQNMSLELDNVFNNAGGVGESSSMGNTLDCPPPTRTSWRCQYSQKLELDKYALKWVDVPLEYIKVIKGDLRRWFMLDFTDRALTRFVEQQMLSMWKEFKGDNHRHFKQFNNSKEACANPPPRMMNRAITDLHAFTVHLVEKADLIKYIMFRPIISRHLAKWAVLLQQYDIVYISQKAIKGQALVDFLADHPIPSDWKLCEDLPDDEVFFMKVMEPWTMYFDGTARKSGEGQASSSILALINGLQMALEIGVSVIEIYGDSKLIINQLSLQYDVKHEDLKPYFTYA